MLSAVEYYNTLSRDERQATAGILEFIVKDKNGNIIDHIMEKNIIKIFAKEMLSHRLPSTEIWDTTANGGLGAWVPSEIDLNEEYSARYIIFGASFDENGTPLGTNDTRFYTQDPVTGQFVPVRLDPSADFGGGLINAIPISGVERPLKKVESINYNNTYQPTGNPLIDASVRSINNILVVESTLTTAEYNGFTGIGGDFFTISEVALAGGRKLGNVGQCGLIPSDLFLQGKEPEVSGVNFESAVDIVLNGSNVITINSSEPTVSVELFKKGDQVRIVNNGGTQDNYNTINQINPNYLIVDTSGGRDLVLDRVPVDQDGTTLIGNVGLFRDTLKIFSHRILNTPVQKSQSFEILCRWTIIFN